MNNNADFDREKMKILMEDAVLSLTWEPVKIYLGPLRYKYAKGETKREKKTGRLAITLRPDLEPHDFYMIFLHEVAHIALGHAVNLPVTDDLPIELEEHHQKVGYLLEMSEEEKREYLDDPNEKEANATADILDSLAKRFAMRWFQSDDIESCLRALSKITYAKGK